MTFEMGFKTTPETNLPAVIGNSVSPYLKVFLPFLETKKNPTEQTTTNTLPVAYSTTAVLHFLTIFLVSYTEKWVLLGKVASEYSSRENKLEIVTQEDFVQEHKRMACNWHVDRARSSQSTTYTFIYTKIKQSYVYNLRFIFM